MTDFRWPEGYRAAACFTFDVDAESPILFEHPEAARWLDVMTHQAYGPRTGLPRILVGTLPEGYDTVIDDDATNLSAGEKQLLTIARAFLADPPILILDEATSSVDTRTEVLIQRAMARLMQGRTTVVIAHRLSTIRDADTILVMNKGAIVEQGTHAELLGERGFDDDLYQSQFAEPLAEAV